MPSVAIVFRKDKLNKKGEAPIHFRIIKDRKTSYIASTIMVPEENWDFENNKIKKKHTNSARLNSFLANKYAELHDDVFEQDTNHKSLTSRQLRNNLFGKKPTDFFPFADAVNAVYLKDKQIGTYDKNRSIVKKLKDYAQGRNLCFQDITPDFLAKYEIYLKETLGNGTNTVFRDFKVIRKIFNDAYKADLIEHSIIPFNKFKLKSEKTERVYLTDEELKAFEEFTPTPGTKLELHKDMFVFTAYSGGMRISDLLQLRWQDFDGSNIHFTIKKTGTQLSIKVPNKGLELIQKYKHLKSRNSDFIFPAMPNDTNLNDERALDNAISSATAYMNKNLTIIVDKIELSKHISCHTSRHTWATRALRLGMSIDKVSKILGHASIRETQVYAKIVSADLDKAMEVFNV